jgi:membrane protein required for colicin V production
MSTVDFVVLIIMVLSIALAVLRGFVREVLTIVAWAGAVFAVLYGLPILKPVGRKLFADETTADIATGAFLGIMTLVLLSVAAHYFGKLIKKSGLTPVDRVLGAVFGAARAALLLCLAYVLIDTMSDNTPPAWMMAAKSQPYLAQGADKLMAALPPSVTDMLKSGKETDKDENTELPPEKPVGTGKGDTDDDTADTPDKGAGYHETERDSMDKLIEKNEPAKANPKQ